MNVSELSGLIKDINITIGEYEQDDSNVSEHEQELIEDLEVEQLDTAAEANGKIKGQNALDFMTPEYKQFLLDKIAKHGKNLNMMTHQKKIMLQKIIVLPFVT